MQKVRNFDRWPTLMFYLHITKRIMCVVTEIFNYRNHGKFLIMWVIISLADFLQPLLADGAILLNTKL